MTCTANGYVHGNGASHRHGVANSLHLLMNAGHFHYKTGLRQGMAPWKLQLLWFSCLNYIYCLAGPACMNFNRPEDEMALRSSSGCP